MVRAISLHNAHGGKLKDKWLESTPSVRTAMDVVTSAIEQKKLEMAEREAAKRAAQQ